MIRKILAATALAGAALTVAACGTTTPSAPVQQKADQTAPARPSKPAGSLSVVETGYGTGDTGTWAASVIKNTTSNVVAFSASFSAYQGSSVIAHGSATGVIRSGATGGVGTDLDLPGGAKVSKVVVTLSTLDSEKDAYPKSQFTATGVHYQADEYGMASVLGEVRSSFVQDVTNVQVEVVCYGQNGHINGGGEAWVDAIGHGQTVGFSADLVSVSGTPARCVAYPMVSGLSEGS
jgi:hypothetical protein